MESTQSSSFMMPRFVLVIAAWLCPVVAASADAKSIVVQHCVKCHEVPGYSAEAAPASINAPAFATLAGKPEVYTEERLRAFLRAPHWPMSQFILSESDIDNLLAYFASLRGQR